MNEIIPGILEKEWKEIEHKLEAIKPFAKTVHIDLIDGKFADNTTFLDPEPFSKYKDTFFLELHLMVENPLDYLKPWANSGFRRFLGHVEKMPDPAKFIAEGKLLGSVGLALDSETDTNVLEGLNFEDLDCLLFMTIQAGKSGQEFRPELLEKIKSVRPRTYVPFEVDGGINPETIVKAKEAGANRFVSTSYLFNSENPTIAYENLSTLVR